MPVNAPVSRAADAPASPHDILARRLAEGAAPDGIQPCHLRQALEVYEAWAQEGGRLVAAPDPSAGAHFLGHLLDTGNGSRTAYARFAAFQVSAALVWGAAATSHLAATLRVSRMTTKPKRPSEADKARAEVAKLPEPWRAPLLATLPAKGAGAREMRRAPVVWSASRLLSVAQALRRHAAFCAKTGAAPVPAGATFEAWAKELRKPSGRSPRGAGEVSVQAYLDRVRAAFEVVLTPGRVYDAAAYVAEEWRHEARRSPKRKGKRGRILPATDIFDLGLNMMAEAEAAPVRRLGEASLYRDGLLLALAACLPERARALSVLTFDETLFLEKDDVVRLEIPGHALKLREWRKPGTWVVVVVENARLHHALTVWRRHFRPMFDDGAWLWPSRLDRSRGLSENSLGQRFATLTEARLGRRIPVHMVRDCVATEIIDVDPEHGAAKAAGVHRHRDRRTTGRFYDQSAGLAAALALREARAARGLPPRQDLRTD